MSITIELNMGMFVLICVVIKRKESYVGNIDFEIYPIIV